MMMTMEGRTRMMRVMILIISLFHSTITSAVGEAEDQLSILEMRGNDTDESERSRESTLVTSMYDEDKNGSHAYYYGRFNLSLEDELKNFPIRDPLSVAIPMTLIYSLILLLGLVGNISTCIVIAKNTYMHTATNYYLFSLAMSDLLLLLSGLPQEIYTIWIKHPYVFGEAFCVIRGLAAETSANATVLTICAFTIERFVAIVYPLKSHKLSQLSRVIRLIGIIWIIAFCLALPQAAQFGVTDQKREGSDEILIKGAWCTIVREIFPYAFQISIFVFFVIPMTLITVLYVLIGLKLRRSRGGGANRNSQELTVEPRNVGCRHSQSHVIRMLIAVVVAFFICWLPFHAQRLMAIYGTSSTSPSYLYVIIYEGLTHVSGILYFMSTCINPILYHIMSKKFRQAFKDTMSRLCATTARNHHNRTYSAISQRSCRLGTNNLNRNNASQRGGGGLVQETCINCRHTPTLCSCRNKSLRMCLSTGPDTAALSLLSSSPIKSYKDGVMALSTLDKSQGSGRSQSQGVDESQQQPQFRQPQPSRLRALWTRKNANGTSSSSGACLQKKSNGASSAAAPPPNNDKGRNSRNLRKKKKDQSKSKAPIITGLGGDGINSSSPGCPIRPRTSSTGSNNVPFLCHNKQTRRTMSYTSMNSSNNTISNSSLQDLDDNEYTRQELAGYLAELKETNGSPTKFF